MVVWALVLAQWVVEVYTHMSRGVMPNGEHGQMPEVMLVNVHSGGQEVSDDQCSAQSGVQTNMNGTVSPRKHTPTPPFQVVSNSSHSQTMYVMHTRLAVPNHQAFGVPAQLQHHKLRRRRQGSISTVGQNAPEDWRMSTSPLMLGMPTFPLFPISRVHLSSAICTEELGP